MAGNLPGLPHLVGSSQRGRSKDEWMTKPAPRVLLRAEQTGGVLAVIELTGSGRPPLHRHEFDETFHVLEGKLTFQVGEHRLTRTTGQLAFAPRGVPHTYANLTRESARALLICTPAGFERYFDRIAASIKVTELPPEAAGLIPEVFTVGPPLGDQPSDGRPKAT